MFKKSLSTIIHLPHYHRDGFSALFWNSSLRQFGISLVSIFIPLYVFHLFLEIPATFAQAFTAIIWFFLLLNVVVLVAVFPASWFIDKAGFRWSVLVSSILMLGHLAALYLAESNLIFLWWAAVLQGLLIPFYWLAYHGIFVEDGQRDRVGREVGSIGVAARTAAAAGPLIGGVVITFFGFHVLFALAFGVILASAGPLFLVPHHRHHLVVSPRRVWRRLRHRGAWRVVAAASGRGIDEMIHLVFWPLYIFLVVDNYEVLGGITSAGLFVSVITAVWVGRLFDKKRKELMFDLGSGGASLIWLGRGLVKTAGQITALEVLDKFVGVFKWLPFSAYTYLLAGKEDPSRFFVFREIIIFSSRSLALIIIWATVLVRFSWWPIFILAALATLMTVFIARAEPKTA